VLASLKVGIGKRKEAEALLRSALEINPKDSECMNLYGCLLSQTGRDSEASLMYRKALAQDPQDLAVILELVKVVERCDENWEDVVSLYRRAAAIEPENPDHYFNLGRVLGSCGKDRKTAAYFFTIAKSLDPYHATSWNSLALSQFYLKQADLAVKTFRDALMLIPDNLELRSNFATVLQMKGEIDEATYHYEALLKMDPHHAQTLCSYSTMISQRYQDHKRALEMLRLASRLEPSVSEIHSRLRRVEHELRNGVASRLVQEDRKQ